VVTGRRRIAPYLKSDPSTASLVPSLLAEPHMAALLSLGSWWQFGWQRKTPTAEQLFGIIVDDHAPGEPPAPHPQSPGVEPRLL